MKKKVEDEDNCGQSGRVSRVSFYLLQERISTGGPTGKEGIFSSLFFCFCLQNPAAVETNEIKIIKIEN